MEIFEKGFPFDREKFNAEMGFKAEDKVLIVHVDDLGACHAENAGTFEALDFGVATCSAIMVPSPWFYEAAAICRENPRYDIGVHLTLTCEYRPYRWRAVSTTDPASGLLDNDRALWRTRDEALANIKPEAAEAELRMQVQMALDQGIDVTHVDAHMGVSGGQMFYDAVHRLCRDFRIPYLVASSKYFNAPLADTEHIKNPRPYEEMVESYFQKVANVKPGITYFITHVAKAGEELAAVSGKLFSANPPWRAAAYAALTSPRMKQIIKEQQIKLIGCREVRDFMRRQGAFDRD